MCYICTCITSIVDILQRLVTFGLACVLCGAVCCGLSVAIIAGIAYGYNYCMAEFITFTRQDVSVYMRRGQFYDRINLPIHRRSGTEEDDIMGMNKTTDYEEPSEGRRSESAPQKPAQPLSDVWMKTRDSRQYAERLTKYSPPSYPETAIRRVDSPDAIFAQVPKETEITKPTDPPVISVQPHALIPTLTWRKGSSDIVMRNFKPLQDINVGNTEVNMPEDLFPTTVAGLKSIGFVGQQRAKGLDDLKVPVKPGYGNRDWDSTPRQVIPEYITEDIDEDSIVYKPV